MADFHFIRPEWLWAIIPLLLVTWLSHKNHAQSQWQSWVANHLSAPLLGQQQSKPLQLRSYLLAAVWVLATLALAGPTFEKIEKPLFKSNRASVIVMDMSMSMRSTDVTPDRLTRSRFKAIDLTTELGDGEVGLVAYAGDAFTISPLTQDPRNIAALIPSLSPEIMPVPGSYPLLGLNKAADIMSQAGYLSGEIYWFTDGVDLEDMDDLREFAASTPYRINVLALGTAMGAPIKMVDGTLLKDRGSIVIPKLNRPALQEISNLTGGQTISATADTSDIEALAAISLTNVNSDKDSNSTKDNGNADSGQQLTGDDWHEAGPWLVLLLMPMLLFVFRKGASSHFMSLSSLTIVTLFTLMASFSPSHAIAAQDAESSSISSQTNSAVSSAEAAQEQSFNIIDKAFNTSDQLGYQAFNKGNYKTAQQQFDDQQWKATAAYKNKDYEQALSLYSNDQSATGFYNQGNALAHLGDLEKAIEAYNQALDLDPSLEQAAKNREILEQLKRQQEQSQSQQQSDQNQQQSGQENQQSDSQQQGEQNQSEQGQSEQQNSQDGPTSNAEQSEQTDSNQQQPQQGENGEDSEQQAQKTQQEAQQNDDVNKADGQLDEEQNKSDSNEAKSSSQAMTPEEIAEQEKQQRIEQLLRKVDDNPSVLLRNKMILENKRRQYQRRYPKGVEKTW